MKLKLTTAVHKPYEEVFAGFDRELFLQLSPPFPPVKLLRFDGCKKGDTVTLELNFIFFKQLWTSNIVDFAHTAEQIYFIDQGSKLPFFLAFWRHRHIIRQEESGASIIDDIEFRSPFLLLDYLLYPVLYLQFAYRKPIYQKVFA